MHKISIVIITKNEEERILQTLESVKWCDEIVVVDSCSTDKTVDICKQYNNCKVYNQAFLGYGEQKQLAVGKASYDWVFSLDADEVVSEALKNEIITILRQPEIKAVGFYVPITLVFLNRIFKYGAENKFFHLRLFNKNESNFNTLSLHESVKIKGKTLKLKNEIYHYCYKDIHHYFVKFNTYTTLYKNASLKKGKRASRLETILLFPWEFIRQYFIRGNLFNGYAGFVWSAFSAFYVFVKYIKLFEANLKNNS